MEKKRIKSMNAFIQELPNGKVVYSYETPVMVEVDGFWYESPKKYSITTGKQKSTIKKLYNINPSMLSHEEFLLMCQDAGATSYGLA